MKRKLFIILAALVFSLPIMAQDTETTPEPTPIVEETPAPVEEPTPAPEEPARDRSETLITVALIVVSIVAVVFGSQLVLLARSAFTTQSPLVQEFIRMNSNRVITELDRRAALTETKLDDEAVAEIRRLVLAIIAEQAPPTA